MYTWGNTVIWSAIAVTVVYVSFAVLVCALELWRRR